MDGYGGSEETEGGKSFGIWAGGIATFDYPCTSFDTHLEDAAPFFNGPGLAVYPCRRRYVTGNPAETGSLPAFDWLCKAGVTCPAWPGNGGSSCEAAPSVAPVTITEHR